MTLLERAALIRMPLTRETVEDIYGQVCHRAYDDRLAVRGLCESHERLRMEAEGGEALLQEQKDEIASVLLLMDGLARQWGDESEFRRCRDRLRNLLPVPDQLKLKAESKP
jgi:hypothetical protein